MLLCCKFSIKTLALLFAPFDVKLRDGRENREGMKAEQLARSCLMTSSKLPLYVLDKVINRDLKICYTPFVFKKNTVFFGSCDEG